MPPLKKNIVTDYCFFNFAIAKKWYSVNKLKSTAYNISNKTLQFCIIFKNYAVSKIVHKTGVVGVWLEACHLSELFYYEECQKPKFKKIRNLILWYIEEQIVPWKRKAQEVL